MSTFKLKGQFMIEKEIKISVYTDIIEYKRNTSSKVVWSASV